MQSTSKQGIQGPNISIYSVEFEEAELAEVAASVDFEGLELRL